MRDLDEGGTIGGSVGRRSEYVEFDYGPGSIRDTANTMSQDVEGNKACPKRTGFKKQDIFLFAAT